MKQELKSIIGICGNARSGKDTMASLISEALSDIGIKNEIISFASSLKEETREFIQQTLGIDTFTDKTEEKQIIRPFLVFWGTHVRKKIDPLVWVKKAIEKMDDNKVYIISDVRFPDEMKWLRSQDSYCIFLDRIDEGGQFIPPANEEEALNNPILKEKSDFQLTWKTVEDGNTKILKPVAVSVLEKTINEEQIALWTQIYH